MYLNQLTEEDLRSSLIPPIEGIAAQDLLNVIALPGYKLVKFADGTTGIVDLSARVASQLAFFKN